jgi:hypothetical protein
MMTVGGLAYVDAKFSIEAFSASISRHGPAAVLRKNPGDYHASIATSITAST